MISASQSSTLLLRASEHATQLIEAIQRALAYAGRFQQAMSAATIIRYLDVRATPLVVNQTLAAGCGSYWREQDGLYCLPGQEALFALTRQRQHISQRQWRQAARWARVMACAPFVRMLAVTGSLAMDNNDAQGDIDYLVISAPGRVWLARLGLIGVVRVARLWGVELCPNYVLSAEALRIEPAFFNARELAQMRPLWGFDVYQQMLTLNSWRLQYLPAAEASPALSNPATPNRLGQALKRLGEWLLQGAVGNRLEAWERERKIARLRQQPGANSPDVILSPEQCKGHFRGYSVAADHAYNAVL